MTNIEKLLEYMKNNNNISLNGEYEISFDYIPDDFKTDINCIKGFSVTIWPKNRDGTGLTIKFNPLNDQICSGVEQIIKENSDIKFK